MAQGTDKAHKTQDYSLPRQNFGSEAHFKGFQGNSAARRVHRKRRNSFYGYFPPCRTSAKPQPETRCARRFPCTREKNQRNLRPYILKSKNLQKFLQVLLFISLFVVCLHQNIVDACVVKSGKLYQYFIGQGLNTRFDIAVFSLRYSDFFRNLLLSKVAVLAQVLYSVLFLHKYHQNHFTIDSFYLLTFR